MGDQERAHVWPDERVHTCSDDAQRVDVEPGVGLVEDRERRLQHRELKNLDALALAAREPVVDVARRELPCDLELLHLLHELLAELGDRDRVVLPAVLALADRVDRAPQEARDGYARNRMRILEREEEPALGALVGSQLGDVLAVQEDLALRHLVRGMPHQRVGKRRLARAVRAHDRVHLVPVHHQIDALDDLGAVFQRNVKILDLE